MIKRYLVVILMTTVSLVVLINTAYSSTFVIYDCNQNGTSGPHPFGQHSTCTFTNSNGGIGTLTTNSYVSYVQAGSALTWTQNAQYTGDFALATDNYDTITVGGRSNGTPIRLTYIVVWSGGYSYSILTPGFEAQVASSQYIQLNGNVIINSLQDIIITTPPQSGSANVSYAAAGGYGTTSGANVSFYWNFTNDFSGSSSALSLSDSFINPNAQLFIFATDPSNGNPLQGITVTGSDGFAYPVNPPCTVCQPLLPVRHN
jgi:hypothetical protein